MVLKSELIIHLKSKNMKTNAIVILFTLNVFAANAGDTIFNTSPNTRHWNTSYMQQKFSDEFNGTNLNQNV